MTEQILALSTRHPRSWATLLVRLALAAVFFYAGATKLLTAPEPFADSIASFRLLPPWAISPLALSLPPFEVLVGIALFTGRPGRLGAFCALLLGITFLLALAAAMIRGIPVECGCFGSGPGWFPLSNGQRLWLDLSRDGLLVVAAFFLYRREVNSSECVASL